MGSERQIVQFECRTAYAAPKVCDDFELECGEYKGGFLRFPEYAPHGYKGDSGTAIIFSCSLLHEATPMISGERFALLSFFYGDEDALVRDANVQYIDRPPEDSRIAETAGLS